MAIVLEFLKSVAPTLFDASIDLCNIWGEHSDFEDEDTVNPLSKLIGKSLLERIKAIGEADFSPFEGQIIEEIPL